jgi:peptidyl-tRNA hydrolase
LGSDGMALIDKITEENQVKNFVMEQIKSQEEEEEISELINAIQNGANDE